MSDKGFTDDQIYAALRLRQDYDSNSDGVIDALAWAASEYLKAKAVIEWYGASLTHSYVMSDVDGFNAYECDAGNKAREYLDSLNKS